jgi:predicted aspartyl protease
MPKYDAENFDPPAPVAYVSLRDPATGASMSNVPMLIDTGADVTLLPVSSVRQLGREPTPEVAYEIQGFDGEVKSAKMVELELVLLGKKFSGQFLLIDQPIGTLGRIF